MKLKNSVQGYGVEKLQENLQLSYNFTKINIVTFNPLATCFLRIFVRCQAVIMYTVRMKVISMAVPGWVFKLKKLTKNDICDLGLLEDIWNEKNLSSKEFIIRLTMTNNLFNKRINCIYESIKE